jgi:predicted amidohydrolase
VGAAADHKRISLRVAAWQGRCAADDPDTNLAAVRRAITLAGEQDAAFLCLPEAFVGGYATREIAERAALSLDDPRLEAVAGEAAERDMVLLLGLSERLRSGPIGNTIVVYEGGRILGLYRKTMLTEQDARQMGYCRDYDLPVFQAKGITFGCIVCHDSSFIEPAATLVYKGAQIIFSPHFNALPGAVMDDHRIRVRNNHIGLAALLNVYIVRANVVGIDRDALGYGDSAIFAPGGIPLAEAGLFRETLIIADIDPQAADRPRFAHRDEVPDRVWEQFAHELLRYRRRDPARAPDGEDFGGRL